MHRRRLFLADMWLAPLHMALWESGSVAAKVVAGPAGSRLGSDTAAAGDLIQNCMKEHCP